MGGIKKIKLAARKNVAKARERLRLKHLKIPSPDENVCAVKIEITDVNVQDYHAGLEEDNSMEVLVEDEEEEESQMVIKEEQEEENIENENEVSCHLSGAAVMSQLGLSYCDNRCLLCHLPVLKNVKQPLQSENLSEANYQAMFILHKMLQVPKLNLADFMKTAGSPYEWIVFCGKCVSLVNQALNVEKQINRLEEKLKSYQRQMLEEIDSSFRKEEQQGRRGPDPVKSTNANIFMVTRRIRTCVHSRQYQSKKEAPAHPQNSTESKAPPLSDPQTIPCSCGGSKRLSQRTPPTKKNVTVRKRRKPSKKPAGISIPIATTTANISNDIYEEEPVTDCPLERNSPPISPFPSNLPMANSTEEENLLEVSKDEPLDPDPSTDHRREEECITVKKSRVRPRHERELVESNVKSLNAGGHVCTSCPDLGEMSFAGFMYHGLFHFRRPLKCSQCGLHFSNSSELQKTPFASKEGAHICSSDTLVHTIFLPGKVWSCANCPEKYSLDTERDSHESTCCLSPSPEIHLQHPCSLCSKKYRSLAEWILHRVLEHPQVTAFSCLFCDEIFSAETKEDVKVLDVHRLNLHIRTKHKFYNKHKVPDECDFCGSIFSLPCDLHSHLEGVHGLKKSSAFSCPICYYRSYSRSRVVEHMTRMHHFGDQEPPKEKETFICDMCGYQSVLKLGFLEHKFSKHGIEPEVVHRFHCCSEEGCSFRTLLKHQFSKHMMKEHKAERKYVCQICGKGFLTSGHLRGHKQIHLNAAAKPFQCEICGNSFALKNYLYIHMRLSHQNRPFASTHKKKLSRRRGNICAETSKNEIRPSPSASNSNGEIREVTEDSSNVNLSICDDVDLQEIIESSSGQDISSNSTVLYQVGSLPPDLLVDY